jgi:protein-S-isoprenylcysteine O-methyltransferase Ste14
MTRTLGREYALDRLMVFARWANLLFFRESAPQASPDSRLFCDQGIYLISAHFSYDSWVLVGVGSSTGRVDSILWSMDEDFW